MEICKYNVYIYGCFTFELRTMILVVIFPGVMVPDTQVSCCGEKICFMYDSELVYLSGFSFLMNENM